MARFSVGGDEDGNEERPSNNRRLPKKPRTSDPIINIIKRASVATPKSGGRSDAAASKAGNPQSTSAAPQVPFVPESQPTVGCGDGVRPTEARVDSTPNGNGKDTESVERRRDAPAPLSFTLTDLDVLDCPICFEPLNPPVYQCGNGHISCEQCCIKMTNKCASCGWRIGHKRCRAIEKVLNSVRISCPNMQYGCKESLSYSRKLDHEKTCNYAPCSCPHPDCTYIGLPNSVYSPFSTHHPNSSELFLLDDDFSVSLDDNKKHVLLRETVEGTLFVLNRSIRHRGSLVNVVCLGLISSKRKFLYEVSASNGVSYVKMKTVAEMTPQWTGQPPERCELVHRTV